MDRLSFDGYDAVVQETVFLQDGVEAQSAINSLLIGVCNLNNEPEHNPLTDEE
jgi:hypothetical protein